MIKGFHKGGIHPVENKLSCAAEIVNLPLPETAYVSLSQHAGVPATPVVAKGDKVLVGQLIGQSAGFISSNVHAPVSGTVTAVDHLPDAGGIRRQTVVIAVEGDEWAPGIDRSSALITQIELSPEEIIKRIADAGVTGMGGAAFPTQVKLTIPPGKKAEMLIINGAECEPYLTADHRLMLEQGEEMLVGTIILARALGVEQIFIGIETNKPDAIAHLTKLAGSYHNIIIIPLHVQYPQGGEKQLIEAIAEREVPSGGLPIDVGVVVLNVATAVATYEAVQKNKPLVERVVTVTGKSLAKPSNLRVRIGTPVNALISACGGMPKDAAKVIFGGPMMGRAISSTSAGITKGTSGVLIMRRKESLRPQASVCIRCSKCTGVCPMGLEPYMLYKLSVKRMFGELKEWYITDCIECGSCSYACPAALPLLDYIRVGKAEVIKNKNNNG